MNHSVYFDSNVSDDVRRKRIYDGQIYLYSPRPSTIELVNLAREMIEDAFGKIDPRQAQHHMPVEKYVEICAPSSPSSSTTRAPRKSSRASSKTLSAT